MFKNEHFKRLSHLLDLEAEAEKQALLQDQQHQSPAEAEAKGVSLINLVVRGEDGGLGSHNLLTLGKRNQSQPLSWTRLRVGTPVVLSEEGGANGVSGWRGVVSRLGRETVQVALPEWPEFEAARPSLRLDRSSDEIPRQRQQQALDQAQTAKATTPLAVLRDILLGQRPPHFHRSVSFKPLDSQLNPSQIEAIRFALTADDLAIIHGPPGTGKTTTVVEVIRQLTQRGQTILACAPSNLAVDNMLERLLAAGEKVVRIGHPVRVQPHLREYTLDLLVENHPDLKVTHKLAREAYTLRDQAGKYTRAKPERGARQAMRQEAKAILADVRRIEEQVFERILDSASIVCATTTGLDRKRLRGRTFDWCVMDEAGQSTEPGAWVPLQYAKRLILAGDHCQLPPTVISAKASAKGLNVSLLERLVNDLGPEISQRLTVQYRMHQDIMAFSSQEFYEASLQAAPSVQGHLLCELPGVAPIELTTRPVLFIDTAGASYDEELEVDGESRYNPQEAELVWQKVQGLLEAGVAATDIAVITPYSAQVKHLRELRDGHAQSSELEIDSVDGFQGREKEAIVVSLVRANAEGQIGFLADTRRLNVALTRARRKLIVIGDSATVTVHPFYERLVNYFESIGAYRSVWEEIG